MLKGFKEFILRGNVVDLAVGVVMGASFGTIVSALVRDIITPLIGAIAKVPDFSNLELRICLYLAGVDPREIQGDAFNWLVSKDPKAFKYGVETLGNGMNERDVAKSLSHAGDYLEGFQVLYEQDLASDYVQRTIKAGALCVYLKEYDAPFDWYYGGGVVAFTGANLAERMFGSKTFGNRKKALELQEKVYFENFPILRRWQRDALATAEKAGYVSSLTGRFLELHGTPEDNAKITVAFLGQGTGADFVQEGMLHFWRRGGEFDLPLIQVHDELDFEVPADWSNEKVAEFVRPMCEESVRLPGFICPITAKRGSNWNEGEMETAFKGGLF